MTPAKRRLNRRVAGAAGALALALASPAAAAADPPPFRLLRHEEDWSSLRDPARRAGALDALKYIPLDDEGDAWLSLGGTLRARYEYARNPVLGEDPQDRRGAVLQRHVLHGDLRLGPSLRAFAQLASALESGRAGPPSRLDENRLDIQQAFLDLRAELAADTDATLRAGRQEIRYGTGRIVDVREGPNVRRKFDGGRVIARLPGWRIEALALSPAEDQTGFFDDGTDDSRALRGVYSVRTLSPGTGVDLYYLSYENERARFAQGRAAENRHSVGARLWGGRAGWDWNVEGLFQWGTFGAGRIQAWSLQSDAGHTFRDAPLAPRLGLRANVASGDRDPGDADLETFNALFPRANYVLELSLLGPQNFFDIHPFVTIRPARDVSLTADLDLYWRFSRNDGIYRPSGQLLRDGAGSDARFVGSALSVAAAWQVNRHIELTAIYAHFWPGAFIRETGPSREIDSIELTVQFVF